MAQQVSGFFDTQDGSEGGAPEAEEWLSGIEKACHTLLNDGEKKARTKPIKIAVLDTGIDSKHPYIHGRIGKNKAFRDIVEFRDGSMNMQQTFPNGEDEVPHGTHVTALLHRVAPLAWIYAARVGFASGEMSAASVATAIGYATSVWEVDLISMSLGFRYDSEDISEAIRKARNSNILLFAAVSNNGNKTTPNIAFPARHGEVIGVSAVNSNSTRLADSNPTVAPGSLAALGIDVPSAWPGSTKPQPKSGSSMATPILAGIAALVLQFVRQLIKDPPSLSDDSKYKPGVWRTIEYQLRHRKEFMVEILRRMETQQGSFCAIQPQGKFETRFELIIMIWSYFRLILDPDPAAEAAGAAFATSQQRQAVLQRVRFARDLLIREIPTSKAAYLILDDDRWDTIADHDLTSHTQLSSWLNNCDQTPCLWLQGEKAASISRSLTALCQQQGSVMLRCECNQFDEEENFLPPATVLRQAQYSALHQVLSHISEQRLPTPHDFNLEVYSSLDNSPKKIFKSMVCVQGLLRELLLHADTPILWVIENYQVLENEALEKDLGFQKILHGFLKLTGAVRMPRRACEPCRCLFVTKTRPAPLTQKAIGDQIVLLDVDEAFGRRM